LLITNSASADGFVHEKVGRVMI